MRQIAILAAALATALSLAPPARAGLTLSPPAQVGIEENCVQERDPELGISGCTAVIRSGQLLGKELAWAYYNRGIAYFKLGEHAQAIEDFDQALRLDPGYAYAYNGRGAAYNALAWELYLEGRNAEALADVDRALADRPDSAGIIDTRAHVLAALGRRGEALAEFERAMQAGKADFVRFYQEALAGHGYYKGAIDGAYGAGTRAALAACLDAGCRVVE
jgi:tetratricopeptide (TPR) repeat protein